MDPRVSTLPQARVLAGEKAIKNLCPVCDDHQLDRFGYCRHLVGFTYDGRHMEPRKRVANFEGGRRHEKVIGVKYGEPLQTLPDDASEDEEFAGFDTVPDLEPVLPSDRVVAGQTSFGRIAPTPTHRVYRLGEKEVPKAASRQAATDPVAQMLLDQVARLSRQVEELQAAQAAE